MAHSFEQVHNGKGGAEASPWQIYDEMIAGIPEGVEVREYALGLNWSCMEAECGCGVAYTLSGSTKHYEMGDLRGMELRQVAELSKSWNFSEATLGVAALNAWYSDEGRISELAASSGKGLRLPLPGESRIDAFDVYSSEIASFSPASSDEAARANVVVVGHFPHVEDIAEQANLVVLERNCRSPFDTPDPACEYIVPDADYVFQTGVTLINKTAPRMLELSRNSKTILVGPSVVPCQALLDHGADTIAGRIVADPEALRFAVATGGKFGKSLKEFVLG